MDPSIPDSASPKSETIQAGDRVLALEPDTGRRWLLQVDGGHARKIGGLGVVDPNRFIGLAWGDSTIAVGKTLVLLRPTTTDLHGTVRRKAQTIGAKDVSRIVFELGIGPGDRVLESGIGSGAATMVLASAVGANGKVVVQELREDFAEWASENLVSAGLKDRVDVYLGDLTQGVAEGVTGPFDAALLDQPEPWIALPNFAPMLARGARVCCFCPQVTQMENVVRTMESMGFCDVRGMELIERKWDVKDRRIRPSSEGLGHTAFLVFGRWVDGAGAPSAAPPG